MYRVMRPKFTKLAGDDGWKVEFTAIPDVLVSSMAEAKRLFGGAPVLEVAR